ncbi:MAG TPA: NAD(+) synthase [Gemmatimonadaceae bacterium]|nr:NAD(+) synthase [Gemmatimonadaceae bacterium]
MTSQTMDALQIDVDAEIEKITAALRTQVSEVLKRRGLIVAMSGGVDSSVCAGLAVRALGPKRVFGLFLPEHDSDPMSLELSTEWARQLGIEYVTEDIAPILEGAGCYRRRNEAIRKLVPEFRDDWKFKIVLPSDRLNSDRLNVYHIAMQPPGGELRTMRLTPDVYRTIVAATNFKQRTRKMMEYYHADRLHYAVVGTPNRLEYDQGFFVKGGDGLADVKPIAHLYKTQVYRLADALGVPRGVTSRPPTTDTYSLPQTQEEFYYLLPTAMMDQVLHAHNAGLSPDEAAARVGLHADQVQRAYKEIEQKRSTTRYLHMPPLLVEPVSELHLDAAAE